MRYYRKILRISYKDRVNNEEVCAKIQQAIGLHEGVLTIVKRRKRMDRPGVREVPEGSGEKEKMEETGCEIICGAQTTLAVKK